METTPKELRDSVLYLNTLEIDYDNGTLMHNKDYYQNKNPRSELAHLLRVVGSSKGDRQHKEEKNIYYTAVLIKLSFALVFVVLMNVSTITVIHVLNH